MSVRIMALVWGAKLGDGKHSKAPARKSVAAKLADHAHDDGAHIYPSVARIAAQAEVSERSVQRILRDFVSEGLLVVTRKGGQGGSGPKTTTEYAFDINVLMGLPSSIPNGGDGLTPPRETSRGDTQTARGDSQSSRGDSLTPKPSLTIKNRQRRARAKPKSGKEGKMTVDPVTGISAKALAEGYALAEGWDRGELLDKFLDLPEPDNPDAAWIGFCRHTGELEGAKVRRFKSSVTEAELVKVDPKKPAIVKSGDPSWQGWIDAMLARGARNLVLAIERAGAMDAPHAWPQPKCALPSPVAPKREREAA